MSELPRRLSPRTNLSANWLNRLLDFLRSRELRAGPGIKLTRTSSGTTVSATPAAPNGEFTVPRLFKCKGGTYNGAPAAFCYLPPSAAAAVRWRNVAVSAPALGTSDNPWVRLPQASGTVWLVLTFRDGSSSSPFSLQSAAPLRWELSFDGTATPTRWPHLIAHVAENGRVEQFHLGPLLLGTPGASGSRTFVTSTVIEQISGVYNIVNKRCMIGFADGLAIYIVDQPDEVIARLGACT